MGRLPIEVGRVTEWGPLPDFALQRKICPSPHVERDAAHSQSAEPGEAPFCDAPVGLGSVPNLGHYRTPRRLSLLCTLRVRRVPFHVWRGADFARQRKIWERRPFWDAPRQQSGAIANVVIATDKSGNAPSKAATAAIYQAAATAWHRQLRVLCLLF